MLQYEMLPTKALLLLKPLKEEVPASVYTAKSKNRGSSQNI